MYITFAPFCKVLSLFLRSLISILPRKSCLDKLFYGKKGYEQRILTLRLFQVKLLAADKLLNGQLLMSFPFIPLTLEDVLASNSRLGVKSTIEQLFHGLAHVHGE